jgi:hypothetical protein
MVQDMTTRETLDKAGKAWRAAMELQHSELMQTARSLVEGEGIEKLSREVQSAHQR